MPTASGAPASFRIAAKVLTPATSSTVDHAICLIAPFCSFGKSAVRITAAVMAAKPMLRSKTSATKATEERDDLVGQPRGHGRAGLGGRRGPAVRRAPAVRRGATALARGP